jgi:cleavage and polyadenylation specificity factor subunit 1
VYEIVAVPPPSEIPPNRELATPVQMFKLQSYTIPYENPALLEQQPDISKLTAPPRLLVPFKITPGNHNWRTPYAGVFLTGDYPLWILCTDKGGVRIHRSQHTFVNAFTPCTLWDSEGNAPEFLMHTEDGPVLVEWVGEYSIDSVIPRREIPMGVAHSHVKYDETTGLLVGAAVLDTRFTLFDEDGQRMWEPDGVSLFTSGDEANGVK